jgi:Tfp pilus assembly protein PilX
MVTPTNAEAITILMVLAACVVVTLIALTVAAKAFLHNRRLRRWNDRNRRRLRPAGSFNRKQPNPGEPWPVEPATG